MSYNTHGGCSNQACICKVPGRTCERFMYYFTPYCVRCGWERHDHDRKPLLHNGRKPR